MQLKHGAWDQIMNLSFLLQATSIHSNTEQACWFAPESLTVIWLGSAAVKWALCIIYFSGQIGFLFSEPIWLLQRRQHVLYSTSLNSLTLQWCYIMWTIAAQNIVLTLIKMLLLTVCVCESLPAFVNFVSLPGNIITPNVPSSEILSAVRNFFFMFLCNITTQIN